MITLRAVPPCTAPTVRMIFLTTGSSAYESWSGKMGPRLDARFLRAGIGQKRLRDEIRVLPTIVPTVLVVPGTAVDAVWDICDDPATAPDHLVVVGAAAVPRMTRQTEIATTVVVGAHDIDPAAAELDAWRRAATEITFRLVDSPEAALSTVDSPVPALLSALFRTDEKFPELRCTPCAADAGCPCADG